MRELVLGDSLRDSAAAVPAVAAPTVVVVVVVGRPEDGPTQGQVLQTVYRRAVAEQAAHESGAA